MKSISKDDRYGQLYKHTFPKVASHIRQNSGSDDDAKDIFQEAMLVYHSKRSDATWELNSSPGTFIFAVSRNLWLKRLRERRREAGLSGNEPYENQLDNQIEIEQEPDIDERLRLLLDRITQTCRLIISSIFLLNQPMELLIQKMGWKNRHTAANQQYKCLQQLKKENQKI